MQECRDRITDAVCAVKVALQSGYVVGGGAALIHASKDICLKSNDLSFNYGVKISINAC